jgi:membrane fusion protein, multidrug efflux system
MQVAQAEGQMARDQALLKNAQVDLERYRRLYAQDSIAKQQVDTQESLVRQYEAAAKVDQVAIDNAKLQLGYCRIRSPLDGRVGLRQVDPGNMVHASDQNGLVVITQLQPIGVVFSIPEDNVAGVMKKVRADQKVPVELYDRAGKAKLAAGSLISLDNQIDATTGSVKLKAQFANADYGLFPNQFVNVRMLVEVKQAATVIPSAAIQRGTQGTFVYAVGADRTATMRPVTLGPVQGEKIAVDAGVAPGEMVVVDGADKLREGTKIDLAGAEGLDNAPAGKGKKHRQRDELVKSGD